MNLLPMDEFLEVYFRTGMDVDGKLADIRHYCPIFEEGCLKFVNYVKELPGFDQLGYEDQMSILKGGYI